MQRSNKKSHCVEKYMNIIKNFLSQLRDTE